MASHRSDSHTHHAVLTRGVREPGSRFGRTCLYLTCGTLRQALASFKNRERAAVDRVSHLPVSLRLAGSGGGLGPGAVSWSSRGARGPHWGPRSTRRFGVELAITPHPASSAARSVGSLGGPAWVAPSQRTPWRSPPGETQPGRWGGAAAWTHCHALTPKRGHAWRGARRGVPSPLAPLPCETPGTKLSFKKLTNFEEPGEPTA